MIISGTLALALRLHRQAHLEPAATASAKRRRRSARLRLEQTVKAMTPAQRGLYYSAVQNSEATDGRRRS